MTPAGRRSLKRYATIAVAVGGVLLGIGALILLGRYASSLADFGRRHVLILAVNAAAAVVLARPDPGQPLPAGARLPAAGAGRAPACPAGRDVRRASRWRRCSSSTSSPCSS